MLLALAPPRGAHADERPSLLTDHQDGELPAVLQLELGGSTRADVSAVSAVLLARFAPSRSAELELELPFVWLHADAPSGARNGAHNGNPYAAAYYVEAEDDGYVRLGAGLAFPASSLDNDASLGDATGTGMVTAMRGGTSAWLYRPGAIGFAACAHGCGEGRRTHGRRSPTAGLGATERRRR